MAHVCLRSNCLEHVCKPNRDSPTPPGRLVVLPDHSVSRVSSLPRFPAQSGLPPSVPLTVCPLLLRAALLRQLKGQAPKRCCCSTALMPVLLDAEYDAFITGQPQHSQQILVVVVTLPVKPGATPEQDAIQQLYRRSNRKRTMPCAQVSPAAFHQKPAQSRFK